MAYDHALRLRVLVQVDPEDRGHRRGAASDVRTEMHEFVFVPARAVRWVGICRGGADAVSVSACTAA